MPPLMRFWFNLHRHNTRPLKDRNMHKIERALYFWPMWAWVYMRGRRLKPEQTITPATAGFLTPETMGRTHGHRHNKPPNPIHNR